MQTIGCLKDEDIDKSFQLSLSTATSGLVRIFLMFLIPSLK